MPNEVTWQGTEREVVIVGNYSYHVDTLDRYIADSKAAVSFAEIRLSRLGAAKAFVSAEAEKSRWDCAGERAYNNFYGRQYPDCAYTWDSATPRVRDLWTAVAKAVIEGEG